MENLILHFGMFILGVTFSCLIFMACFMPIYKTLNKRSKWHGKINTTIFKAVCR